MGNHVTFSQESSFRQKFGRQFVREDLLATCLRKLSAMLSDVGHFTGKEAAPPVLILVLSRVAIDFSQQLAQSLVSYPFCIESKSFQSFSNEFHAQMSLIEEQFDIPASCHDKHLTPMSTINQDFKQASQTLLQSYVQSESHILVQVNYYIPLNLFRDLHNN